MNRRDLLHGLGALAVSSALPSGNTLLIGSSTAPISPEAQLDAKSLPPVVAGVWIVDSKIAKLATVYSRMFSPPYLFNHAMRTFLFGALVG